MSVPPLVVAMISDEKFSDELERWLQSDDRKSLGALGDVFAEKSFAVAILVLMLASATPVPTGGVALLFQLVAGGLAVQLILGRHTMWLPRRWRQRELGNMVTGKAIPFIVRRVRWFEKRSRPRWQNLFEQRLFIRVVGVVLLAFIIASALAPPLTGLEILPSLGAVVIALAVILEDIVVFIIGVTIGTGGIVLFVLVGAAIVRLVSNWF